MLGNQNVSDDIEHTQYMKGQSSRGVEHVGLLVPDWFRHDCGNREGVMSTYVVEGEGKISSIQRKKKSKNSKIQNL